MGAEEKILPYYFYLLGCNVLNIFILDFFFLFWEFTVLFLSSPSPIKLLVFFFLVHKNSLNEEA